MLIHNIDVLDGLSNGTRGELIAVERDAKGKVEKLIIKFDEEYQGAQKRKKELRLSTKYPGCTPIGKYLCSYSLAKKATVAYNTAQVYQFPVVVFFVATTHKFQGGTVHKPSKLAVDIRTAFDDTLAYVMFSRVQDIEQLFIVGDLPEHKIRTSEKCLAELKRLTKKSVNENPGLWEKDDASCVKISFLNCHSLMDKFKDINADKMLSFSDIICLSETWLPDDECKSHLHISGYELHLNSCGKGKGLAIYYKTGKFEAKTAFKDPTLQISQLLSTDLNVIVCYRSKAD